MDADADDVVQKSYRLQASLRNDFNPVLWDSGMVAAADSVHVEYSGPPLKSCTRYFWRVRITDNHGQESQWSPAHFETAFLDPSLCAARFITPAGDEPADSKGMRLRKEFSLDGGIAWGRIYATALGMYELSLNGARVGDALFTPGWTAYKKRLLYQTYDVTALLRSGANAIGATLGSGWYKGDLAGWVGRRNLYGGRTGLLCEIMVRYTDGRETTIVSDESWKTSEGPILYSELYHGETYDARREQPGWDAPGFNDTDWRPAQSRDQDIGILAAQDGPAVKRQETIAAVSLFTTPKGEKVLDFGQNLAGWVRFTVRGQAGQKVVLRHAEILDAAGNFYTANLRSAKARIEYVLKGGGVETFEPHFTFQGFRYVRIEEYPGEPSMKDFTAVVIHSDMESTGSFTCSHPLLNALAHNILWSLKGNFIDIPTDCPQRDERLGWTGDAQVFIRTACFSMGTGSFFTKWLRDLSAEQRDDGGVPFVIPDALAGVEDKDPLLRQSHSSCGWGDAAVICPWTIYQCYGDRRILERQYGSMKGWVEYIRARARNGVLWNSGFHFGDWVALDAREGSYFGATPNDLTATAFYAHSTDILSQAAAVLGRRGDAREYRRLHARIVTAFRDEFFTATGRLAARTQTAHILALCFGLAPEEHRGRVIETLLALMKENGGHLTTGFLGTPYFCRVLSDNSRLEEAYALLLKEDFPSWLYQITKGATTIWEHWDGIKPDGTMWSPDMNSFNHYAYGAVGDWLYRTVAGLDTAPESPGYKRIVMRPRPGGGLTHAKAEYMSPYGSASIAWQLDGSTMRVDVLVPHNTTARVVLPGAVPRSVEGGSVRFTQCEGGAEAVVGSGRRVFTYPCVK
jgi:alpha-L-rhamnosidase